MKSIFQDETGDLGFDFTKEGTSDYFIIAFLITENPKQIQSVIKKTFIGKTNRYFRKNA